MARIRGLKRASPDGSDGEYVIFSTSGKSPTLRPKLNTPPSTTETSMTASQKPAASAPAKRTKLSHVRPTHLMKTRSKAKAFNLMELPAELRNNIYGHVFQSSIPDPASLTAFTLPSLLSVSKEVRSEALPVFFAEKLFTIRLRSNWCFRSRHFHGPAYIRYSRAGQVRLSPVLKDGRKGLPKEAIRFRRVKFVVECVCCVAGVEMGSVCLGIAGKTPTVESRSSMTTQPSAIMALESMVEEVEKAVAEIAGRDRFNGFTVEDIVRVGKCFRIEERDEPAVFW